MTTVEWRCPSCDDWQFKHFSIDKCLCGEPRPVLVPRCAECVHAFQDHNRLKCGRDRDTLDHRKWPRVKPDDGCDGWMWKGWDDSFAIREARSRRG